MSQYSAPNYYVAPNPLATWALVLGIVSLVLSPFIVGGVIAIVALILGVLASKHQQGKGMAITGIILAALAIAVAGMAGLVVYKIYNTVHTFGALMVPQNQAHGEMIAFELALNDYESDKHHFPTTAEGLDALKAAAPGGQPYLTDIPPDPWGHPYMYESFGVPDPDEYAIKSKGPDGVLGTADDITQRFKKP